MGIHIKNFCDRQRKDKNGHVRYLLDMSEKEKDAAVVAFLLDDKRPEAAALYQTMSNEGKNYVYGNVESRIIECIDKYNLGADLDKELAGDIPLTDDEMVCV